MKKWIFAMVLISSVSYASEDFQNELKLPETHYSQKERKVVVKVQPDFNNSQNLQQQEEIVNKIEEEVGPENLIIIEEEKTEN
jgi:hypothetical protein